ncbi:MAG: hypothetical protein AB7S26_13580 [Sandaracinaceae bacterium]
MRLDPKVLALVAAVGAGMMGGCATASPAVQAVQKPTSTWQPAVVAVAPPAEQVQPPPPEEPETTLVSNPPDEPWMAACGRG